MAITEGARVRVTNPRSKRWGKTGVVLSDASDSWWFPLVLVELGKDQRDLLVCTENDLEEIPNAV